MRGGRPRRRAAAQRGVACTQHAAARPDRAENHAISGAAAGAAGRGGRPSGRRGPQSRALGVARGGADRRRPAARRLGAVAGAFGAGVRQNGQFCLKICRGKKMRSLGSPGVCFGPGRRQRLDARLHCRSSRRLVQTRNRSGRQQSTLAASSRLVSSRTARPRARSRSSTHTEPEQRAHAAQKSSHPPLPFSSQTRDDSRRGS